LTHNRGGRVTIKVPQRGEKRSLLDTVQRNAEQALVLHKTRRSGDLTTRSKALSDLMEVLELPAAPLRIECFDISHLGGSDPVASMVVFEDGLPRPPQYRTFGIRGPESTDDTRAMQEVLRRRYLKLAERGTVEGSFAYEPALVMVDGGAPQVNAAAAALQDVGMGELPVIGLAKRLEEVWLPDCADPVILPRGSEALYLLQRVRDEAHRFAIKAQRRKRTAALQRSALDDIPGLGPARRKALLRTFGSVKALRAASPAEIATVPGIGPTLAATVHRALTPQTAAAMDTVEPQISEGATQ
jgi:excinuclease ABC subunit C